jgi:hypothetical protein
MKKLQATTIKKRPSKTASKRSKYVLKDGTRSEKSIQDSILRWLKKTNLIHWRAMAGHLFMGKRRYIVGPEGLPDIIVVMPPNGKFLGLEVKSARGKLRPCQVEFCKKATDNGAVYRVVRSLQQAKEAVAEAYGREPT